MRKRRALTMFALAVVTGLALVLLEIDNSRIRQRAAELGRQSDRLSKKHARKQLTVSHYTGDSQLK